VALAAVVPCPHESTLTRSVRNLLCYNFLQPLWRGDRILIAGERRGWLRFRRWQQGFEHDQTGLQAEQAHKESQITMSSTKQKLRLVGAFAALAILALAVSCKGFFVNPILTTITVDPPTPSINQGATQQMTATATYQDSSTSTLKGGTSCSGNTVCWSSSDTTVLTISTGGLATGVGQGTATITAASGAIVGTTQATVDLTNVTNFQVCEGTFGATIACSSGATPLTWSVPNDNGQTQTFISQGSSGGQTVDLTASSTWTMTSAAPATGSIECTNSGVSPETCTVANATTAGTYTFTVTYGTNNLTATLNIVVP
jgi:hypothetical protein